MEQLTEIKAAKLLLKRGVELMLPAPFFLRLFGKKQIKLTLKTPCLESQLAVSEAFLQTGIFLKEDEISMQKALEILSNHGVRISEIIAMAIQNETRINWRIRRLAKRLRKNINTEEMSYLFSLLVAFSGVHDFTNTIRLIQETRITKPMNLSPTEKTS
ncbi:hypothetical protein JSO53_04235 [Riemerella anatipestifer]|uniref:Uncharacterized protein n=1 Tax=Riemerella anatipestifer TaxID=34085 RepID=A0AAP6HGG2_RIEAN|nr:hypothetical protein [Riemerella anatipestifer]AGC39520.1 hypothetical protein G148_0215 [Riemerella anatipestifer RA-CH-2]AKP71643.1 hypothetical protein CG09_1482 [Riemerella anatipestifer]MBT0561952.1 hypothetical protein [Riemerella anatipestifer]MCU7571535.1 hypothetical protein [Riemerella anatipestifer]MCU7574298.1 hypothetical protein [Riemerella anatipestifer]